MLSSCIVVVRHFLFMYAFLLLLFLLLLLLLLLLGQLTCTCSESDCCGHAHDYLASVKAFWSTGLSLPKEHPNLVVFFGAVVYIFDAKFVCLRIGALFGGCSQEP